MYSKEKLNEVIETEKFNFLLFEIEKQLVGLMWFNNFMANNKNIKHPKVSKTDIFKSFC